jgi:short subunit dehydrogenase-like uncharacterized protein
MAREVVYMRIILEEMGHKQPATPIQTDNAMAEAVVNAKITQTIKSNGHAFPLAKRQRMPTTIQILLATRQTQSH